MCSLLIFIFFNFTHKGRKYLTIIEHIFYFIIPVSCQNLSSIHANVKHKETKEYENIFSYLSDGSYIKGKDFLFIYQY
jgi:hypothetical protein